MSNFDYLPDEQQPSSLDHARRFGPAAVIGLVSLLFILQNTENVTFNFLWFDFRWPLWIMLIGFMVAGAAVGWGITHRIKSRKTRQAKRKEAEEHRD
ncbi:MAG: LapA family protein [Ilumatobacteraceae bacterium]